LWWPYGLTEQEAAQSVSSILKLYLEQGQPYFARFSNFPSDFTRVTPATPETDYATLFPRYYTEVRRDLALARISQKLGNADAAHFFANRGMARIGLAVGLKAAFRAFLQPFEV